MKYSYENTTLHENENLYPNESAYLFSVHFLPQYSGPNFAQIGVQTVPNFIALSSQSFQYTFPNSYGFVF